MGRHQPVVSVVDPTSRAAELELETLFHRMTRTGAIDFVATTNMLHDDTSRFIIVRPSPEAPIAAYALLTVRAGARGTGEAEVEQLYSDKKGKGYGRLAMRAAEDLARAMGAHEMLIEAVPQAVGFYLKLGYVPSGDALRKQLQ